MTDARNFLLNTDYPMDKIIYMTSGSVIVDNNTNDTIELIKHGLPFTPLAYLVWSNTDDFNISFLNTDDVSYPSTTYQLYSVYSTSESIFMNRFNTTGSTKTVYYRIFCYAPSTADVDSAIEPTATASRNFIINTDYNYFKLAYSGVLDGVASFNHNLGYVPQALVWQEATNGNIYSVSQASTGTANIQRNGIYITNTTIGYIYPSSSSLKHHYRIYIDE